MTTIQNVCQILTTIMRKRMHKQNLKNGQRRIYVVIAILSTLMTDNLTGEFRINKIISAEIINGKRKYNGSYVRRTSL